MRLMIVDDNADMRRLIKTITHGLADSFIECSDGLQALQQYAAQKPDWVLMDIEMPTLDGIAATKEIKLAFPSARILIVTEYDDAYWREESERAGACGYVLKDSLSQLRSLLVS